MLMLSHLLIAAAVIIVMMVVWSIGCNAYEAIKSLLQNRKLDKEIRKKQQLSVLKNNIKNL